MTSTTLRVIRLKLPRRFIELLSARASAERTEVDALIVRAVRADLRRSRRRKHLARRSDPLR